jgi:hypothetical protein
MEAERISVREISRLARGVFEALERAGIEEVEVDRDQYWCVFPSDSLATAAPGLTLGDVTDDLKDLKSEVDDPESPLKLASPWHALHHLHGIIGYLAAKAIAYELPEKGRAQ